MKKILIIKNDNIGDLVLATSVFRELKKIYPESEITIIASKINRQIIEKNPNINFILELPMPKKNWSTFLSYYKLLRIIKKKKFDIGIDLRGSTLNAFLLWKAKIKKRVSYIDNHPISKIFLTNPIKLNSFLTSKHVTRENIDILNKGLDLNLKNSIPEIFADKEDKENVKKFIRKNKIKKYICINPNASLNYKKWSSKNYNKIISSLENYPGKILIIGTKNEEDMVKNMIGKNKNCIPLLDFNLRELYLIYKGSDLVLTNDGGPMHLAWTSGTKVIALFAKYPEKLKKDILRGKKTKDYLKKVFPLKNSKIIQSKGESINDIKIEEVKREIGKTI